MPRIMGESVHCETCKKDDGSKTTCHDCSWRYMMEPAGYVFDPVKHGKLYDKNYDKPQLTIGDVVNRLKELPQDVLLFYYDQGFKTKIKEIKLYKDDFIVTK